MPSRSGSSGTLRLALVRLWRGAGVLLVCFLGSLPPESRAGAAEAPDFVNWETAPVHPLELTPDGRRLLAVNLPDNRLEVFDLRRDPPLWSGSISVGLDPVSVRARTNREAWVVNQISDTVSVVDLDTGNVVRTVGTLDEPSDVVFAGTPPRAFISCSQSGEVRVVDVHSYQVVRDIAIEGEEPRALAVSPDGRRVYAAIFESGNGTTILGGGIEDETLLPFPPNVVNHPEGPYQGRNPPPGPGLPLDSRLDPATPPPPAVGLIVRRDAAGRWWDDNQEEWTEWVTGTQAGLSGRVPGWDLADHDIAVIDAERLSVETYIRGLMNLVMGIAVGADGRLAVVGTDALNQVRFEPRLKGRFATARLAVIDPLSGQPHNADLNAGHLDYSDQQIEQESHPERAGESLRRLSIGDPRAVVWEPSTDRLYVAGMGSSNVVRLNSLGDRLSLRPIEVGEGPAGLALDSRRGRLYVLNRFGASISIVELSGEREVARIPFFDPTPQIIRRGRPHLYDTRDGSALGQLSCASCHVDGKTDRLAWDLGIPADPVRLFNQNCVPFLGSTCGDWHPMKGPMLTQTLQDIIGKEPLHWRGDRQSLEEFGVTFQDLLGRPQAKSDEEMGELKAYLATLHYPPNPFRELNNGLSTHILLPPSVFHTVEKNSPVLGNAERGRVFFQSFERRAFLGRLTCSICHTRPTGAGSGMFVDQVNNRLTPFPLGSRGEEHLQVTPRGFTNHGFKIPQLRNLYKRAGFDMTSSRSLAGFGFGHDGSLDTLERFLEVSTNLFGQDRADVIAYLLSFSGNLSDQSLDIGPGLNPPGPPGRHTHAAVGAQLTLDGRHRFQAGARSRLQLLVRLAEEQSIGLVAKGRLRGRNRGFVYLPGGRLQSDCRREALSVSELWDLARPGSEITFTAVPRGSERRIGIDRDRDGILDADDYSGGGPPLLPHRCRRSLPQPLRRVP